MNIIIFIGAVLLYVASTYGASEGVGSYSYSDSSGRRYGGVYGLKDGKVVEQRGNFPPNFQPPSYEEPNFQDIEFNGDFFPQYFKNLENILEEYDCLIKPVAFCVQALVWWRINGDGQNSGEFSFVPPIPFFPPFMPRRLGRPFATPFSSPFGDVSPFGMPNFSPFDLRAFRASMENQKLAFDSARKAFDITSNRAHFNNNPGYTRFNDYDTPNVPRFPSRSAFDFGGNSAFASGAIGSGYQEQIAAINPENPQNPNVKVTRLSDPAGRSGYKSVSVSSFSSSGDINGQRFGNRQASTIIDDNGKVTRYDVRN